MESLELLMDVAHFERRLFEYKMHPIINESLH